MEIRPISKELQKKAKEELNEDSSRVQEAYEHIKEWLRKQPHLNLTIDHQIMVAFFRGCKWNLNLVKEKIDNFYSSRSFMLELFENKDPLSTEIQKILKSQIVIAFPRPNNYYGPRICMLRLGNANPNNTPVAEIMKVLLMTLEILMKEDDCFVISGLIMLADYKNYPTSIIAQYTPTLLKNYVNCMQNCYPIRIKSYVILNAPSVYHAVYNAVKAVISSKVQERVKILNSRNTISYLKELKEFIPKEYGGTNGVITDAAEQWRNKVESYRDWFLADQKNISNEKLRLGESKLFRDEFGAEGTFRKLVID